MSDDDPHIQNDVLHCLKCDRQPLFLIWSPLNKARSQFVLSGACADHLEEIEDAHLDQYEECARWPSIEGIDPD